MREKQRMVAADRADASCDLRRPVEYHPAHHLARHELLMTLHLPDPAIRLAPRALGVLDDPIEERRVFRSPRCAAFHGDGHAIGEETERSELTLTVRVIAVDHVVVRTAVPSTYRCRPNAARAGPIRQNPPRWASMSAATTGSSS
jgi:hypothetical protein